MTRRVPGGNDPELRHPAPPGAQQLAHRVASLDLIAAEVRTRRDRAACRSSMPDRAGGGVLEGDAASRELVADAVGFGEVARLAAATRAATSASISAVVVVRAVGHTDVEARARSRDATTVATSDAAHEVLAPVDRDVGPLDRVEDRRDGGRGAEVVVHRGAERRDGRFVERGARDVDLRTTGPADQGIEALDRLARGSHLGRTELGARAVVHLQHREPERPGAVRSRSRPRAS